MASNSEAGGSSKKKRQTFSTYNKKQFLTLLKSINCNPNKEHTFFKQIRKPKKEETKDFINQQAKLCQNRLNHEMRQKKNTQFINLDTCAKNLSRATEVNPTDNTLPVTLEAILNNENLPSPDEVGGIDLKKLYHVLANLMAGYPVEPIEDGPTRDFLMECFSELMESTEEMDVKAFRDYMVEQDKDTQPVYSWLCNGDYNQYLLKMFKDNNLGG